MAQLGHIEELVFRAKRGEVEAFQGLHGVYAKNILNYACRKEGKDHEAMKLWEKAIELESSAP